MKGYDQKGNIIYELDNGNGAIKIYYYSNIFEGKYLNGQRNGKGKEYNDNGKLFFEGEYINDERNGKGKEYSNNGKLIFEGDYLDNKKYIGKFYIDNVLEFEGEYKRGKKWNGIGYDKNGNILYKLIKGDAKKKRI